MGVYYLGIHFGEPVVHYWDHYYPGHFLICKILYAKSLIMTQNDVPVSEDTYEIFTFLSGMGLWLILALVLIGVFVYKKFKK